MKDSDYGYVHLTLKEIIEKRNIPVPELLRRAKMQLPQLEKYLCPELQQPDLRVLCRLCHTLDCNIADLFEYGKPDSQAEE